MTFENIFVRIKRIDKLIQLRATGSATQLSKKLNISRKMTYNYLNLMKELGAPIYYNKELRSFCYKEKGSFKIEF